MLRKRDCLNGANIYVGSMFKFCFFQRREYPDGTIRILYNDGRYETRSYKMTLIELRTDMKASFLL